MVRHTTTVSSDLAGWIGSVVRHGLVVAGGATISIALLGWEHFQGEPLTWPAAITVFLVTVFAAVFLSWREQHHAFHKTKSARTADVRIATLTHPDATEYSNEDRVKEIDNRIQTMEDLYLQWALDAKSKYRQLNNATIAFSAAVPVVVLIPVVQDLKPWTAALAGILGACATLSKSIDSLYKNHDTWLRNNDAYGKLKAEHFLFYERAGMYKGLNLDDRITLYADRVEAVIGSETQSWAGAEKAPQG